jgi:hypothetical protein
MLLVIGREGKQTFTVWITFFPGSRIEEGPVGFLRKVPFRSFVRNMNNSQPWFQVGPCFVWKVEKGSLDEGIQKNSIRVMKREKTFDRVIPTRPMDPK